MTSFTFMKTFLILRKLASASGSGAPSRYVYVTRTHGFADWHVDLLDSARRFRDYTKSRASDRSVLLRSLLSARGLRRCTAPDVARRLLGVHRWHRCRRYSTWRH